MKISQFKSLKNRAHYETIIKSISSSALVYYVKALWIVFKHGLNRAIVEDVQYQNLLLAVK
ncbi:hypothetical protein CWC16_13125 [Pseudoalteromonas sp. S3776]|nr:hypothetical protein CWC16_13125 [Pseudoalteromonas sp. S3776]